MSIWSSFISEATLSYLLLTESVNLQSLINIDLKRLGDLVTKVCE